MCLGASILAPLRFWALGVHEFRSLGFWGYKVLGQLFPRVHYSYGIVFFEFTVPLFHRPLDFFGPLFIGSLFLGCSVTWGPASFGSRLPDPCLLVIGPWLVLLVPCFLFLGLRSLGLGPRSFRSLFLGVFGRLVVLGSSILWLLGAFILRT